jgi:hypothetical protein
MASRKKSEQPASRPGELLPGLFVLYPRGVLSLQGGVSSRPEAEIFVTDLSGNDGYSYVSFFLAALGMTTAGARNDNGRRPN